MTVAPPIHAADSVNVPVCDDARRSMSSALRVELTPMQVADLPQVEAIERAVYAHPWSMLNFRDSVASGYECWVARDRTGELAGYFLLMVAPDEVHLLNITVPQALHGLGIGRLLFERACGIGRVKGAPAMLLEVRPSNLHARAVYRHLGFTQIGVRKNYYPALDGKREDALVMRLPL